MILVGVDEPAAAAALAVSVSRRRNSGSRLVSPSAMLVISFFASSVSWSLEKEVEGEEEAYVGMDGAYHFIPFIAFDLGICCMPPIMATAGSERG